jgi:hypothetical protein
VTAFDSAQELRNGGELVAARKQLGLCAAATCPEPIRNKCVPWLAEVSEEIPSILVIAKGVDGGDTADVKVLSDGKVVAERLDGRPIELDPGEHSLRFEHPGGKPIDQTLVLVAGTKRRRVEISFEGTAEPSPDPLPQPLPAPPPGDGGGDAEGGFLPLSPVFYAGVAVAGAGLILGAVTGGLSASKKSELDDQCASTGCTEDDIASGENLAHVSTAGFALAGAGAALALVGLLVFSGPDDEPSAGLRVGPGGLWVSGAF